MGFARRAATTGKALRPEGARQEAELTLLNSIANKVEEFQIPPSLILNIDQINSKYVSMAKATMAKKCSRSLPIGGLSELEFFYLCNLFVVEKLFKVYLNLVFMMVSLFLQTLNTAVAKTVESIKITQEIIIP